MNITKKDLSKKISSELNLNNNDSKFFLEEFLNILKKEIKIKTIKISKFGTFKTFVTPKRLGRNPKTKKNYIIESRNRLSFTPSNAIKRELN